MARIVRQAGDMRRRLRAARGRGARVAMVPTMGDLHDGHLALIRQGRVLADRVVVSVFVNPTQFGPGEDYGAYPRNERRDLALASEAGASWLYAPKVPDMYPPGFATRVAVPQLSSVLCGRSRPGHFAGVATVVLKLVHQLDADVLVMGQKDAQQALIIRRMLRDLDLDRPRLRVAQTVREADGLAMSSRNRYLTAAQRAQAPVLYRALVAAVRRIQTGERRTRVLRRQLQRAIQATPGAELDYAELVDIDNLVSHDRLPAPVLIAVAARFGRARLIDNVIVTGGGRTL